MKQRGVFLIGLILITVYYFLFPRGSGKELVFRPKSIVQLSGLKTEGENAEAAVGLLMGNRALFLDRNSIPVKLWEGERLAVADEWWAQGNGTELEIRDRDGRLRSRISSAAYPFTSNGFLFSYEAKGGALSKIDPENGRILWSRQFISVLTVVDARQGRSLIGLLDGRCLVIDDNGEIIFEYKPGGSKFEGIYGGAFSQDGSRVALIAGLEPQRFILLEERKNGFRPVTHHSSPTDFRRYVPVGFARHDSVVIYEGVNQANTVDPVNFQQDILPFNGSPISWTDSPSGNLLAFLAFDRDRVTVEVLTRSNLPLFVSQLPDDFSTIRFVDKVVYLIGENSYAAVEMVIQ